MIPKTRAELFALAMGKESNTIFEVRYEVNGMGNVLEATVTKCKNGAVVNYVDDYMRRRDPDCLIVGDEQDTDKPKFEDVYNKEFNAVRTDTFEWLKTQELIFYLSNREESNMAMTRY